MSLYEQIDYDSLLDRIGVPHNTLQPDGSTLVEREWFCGPNPEPNYSYDDARLTYDDVLNYNGRNMHKPGGLCLYEDVNVNGLVLNRRDEDGTLWLCTGIEGWWTLPPSEIIDVPKPYWDGSMLTTGRYLSRTITISGCFIPPHPSWVWRNRDRLLRHCSIVRGVGLLATCGNQSPSNPEMLTREVPDPTPEDPAQTKIELYRNEFFDPAKMAIIQTADVPLIETVRSDGFTQFSLSFKCAIPTKASIKEKNQAIPIPDKLIEVGRAYHSFTTRDQNWNDPDTFGNPDTAYSELTILPKDPTRRRKYSDVKFYNPDAPIVDETYESTGGKQEDMIYYNGGNYFTFPLIVFEPIEGINTTVTPTKTLEINNDTTDETVRLVKPIPLKHRLIVDSLARRVALVADNDLGRPEYWTWNDRDYLSLDSEWLSLAPGENKFFLSKNIGVGAVMNAPRLYWRDAWIG